MFKAPQDHSGEFTSSQKVKIKFPGIAKEYVGTTMLPMSAEEYQLIILVNLDDTTGLIRGLKGEISPA